LKHQPLVFAAVLCTTACAARITPSAAPVPARAPVAAPAPAAQPAALRYSVGTSRYRLEQQTHVEQEMMGQVNATDISTGALFTVAMADAEGNVAVTITIDSLAIGAAMGAPSADELAAARGKTVRLVLSPTGRAISMTAPDSAGATLLQIAQGLREFLPLLPPGSTEPGTTWYDTTSTTAPSSGLMVTAHITRQHRVAGWEDRGGARALHVATTATYTVTGSGEVQGQAIELAGGGLSATDAFVSAAGVYLGSTVKDSALVNASVVSAGMVVPVRRTTRSTFTRLP
jgi:hypothetical protein